MNSLILRRDVCDWINGVSSLEGRVYFDVDGTCRVYSGELECCIEIPENKPIIIFYIPVAKVDVENRAEQLEHALTLNLLQHKTGGASVAYDPKVDLIVLNQVFQAAEMTEEVFHNVLLNLIEVANNTVSSFDEFDVKSESDTQAVGWQIPQGSPHNLQFDSKSRIKQ